MSDQPHPHHDLDVSIPSPEGLKVTRDRPYRILIVGDFGGASQGKIGGSLENGIVELTAANFDAILAEAGPTVDFAIADPTQTGSVMAAVNLRFDSLRAFDPLSIAGRFPSTRGLLAAREHIVSRLLGKSSSEQLAQTVAKAAAADATVAWLPDVLKWSPAARTAPPGAVDSILNQIDLGDEVGASAGPQPASAGSPKSAIGSLVAAAAGGASIPAEEASSLRHALAEIDRHLSAWLTAILHAPAIQQLEAAWRGVAFLVKQTDFRKGVRLALLHAPRAVLTARFRTLVIDPVFDEGADAPDVIVTDYAFASTAGDVETLDELAQHAASLPAVVLAGAAPAFLGVKHAWQIPTLPPLISLLDQYQFAKWKTLRGQPYARHIGVVLGRGLLRVPYGQGEAASTFDFHYREPSVSDSDFLWANGPTALAVTIARSMADTGWPTAMAGMVHGQVPGLAVAKGGKNGEKTIGPTDTPLTPPKIEELAAFGLTVVAALRDAPDPIVWNGLSAGRPLSFDTTGLLEVSLPYQLFAARLSSLLFALKPHLAGQFAEQVVTMVHTHVVDWLSTAGAPTPEQASVQTKPAEDDPHALQLAVTVTPPPHILPGGIPFVMGYRLG